MSIDKHKFREGIYNAIDAFESQDLGISGIPGLYGRSHLVDMGDSWVSIFYVLLSEFPDKVLLRVPEFLNNSINNKSNSIETLELNIKFKDWNSILLNRSNALRKTGLLVQRDKVNVKGNYSNYPVSGKLRLKGDFSDHWRSARRMSLNITLSKSSKSVKGYKRFNLHKPAARQFPYEQAFQRVMNKLGIASVQHGLVRVVVNGEDWGVMNIQETYSTELLEKQKRKDSLIFKLGDESEKWNITGKFGVNTRFRGGYPQFSSSIYNGKKNLEARFKREQFSYFSDRIENKDLRGIVDEKKFTDMALFTLLWGDAHVTRSSNSRYYLNPYNLKLEPLSSDQSMLRNLDKVKLSNIQLPAIYKFALEETINKDKLSESIDSLFPFLKISKEYGSEISSYFPNDHQIDYSVLDKNFIKLKNNKINKVSDIDDHMLSGTGSYTSDLIVLNKAQWNTANNFVSVRHYEDGNIRIYNNLPIPVIVKKILYNGDNILKKEITLEAFSVDIEGPTYTSIRSDIKGIHDSKITVISSIGNFTKQTLNSFTHTVNNFNPLENIELQSIKVPNFISRVGDNYSINPGEWVIESPLVIKGNLTIAPSTTIKFSKDAYLIVNGRVDMGSIKSPLPVLLTSLKSTWKGIYILGNKEPSSLNNVTIKNATNLHDGILNLSGSLNFYNSDITINNLNVENIKSEDAINIINSNFAINNLTIFKTSSDALDIDFSDGIIKNINISSSNGDALDFSGSKVEIESAYISNVKDKALSIGEGSNIKGSKLFFKNVGVGIATKDGSFAEIENLNINNFSLAGVMTYVKKDFYDSPTLKMKNVSIKSKISTSDMLRQHGTFLFNNSNLIDSINLNAEELYQSSLMKKEL